MIFVLLMMAVFISLVTKNFHLLSFFIGLEIMSLFILMYFSVLMSVLTLDLYVLMFFLCALACESALGLVLFVMFNRYFSKDYYLLVGTMKF